MVNYCPSPFSAMLGVFESQTQRLRFEVGRRTLAGKGGGDFVGAVGGDCVFVFWEFGERARAVVGVEWNLSRSLRRRSFLGSTTFWEFGAVGYPRRLTVGRVSRVLWKVCEPFEGGRGDKVMGEAVGGGVFSSTVGAQNRWFDARDTLSLLHGKSTLH